MTSYQPLDLDDIAARAAGLYEYATGLDEAWQAEADQLAGTDVPALLAEVRRLRARTLTAGEYNAAWHAVEGAAGEEGADPGTVLHAVLDRLGIAWQDAAVPAAGKPATEVCGKCRRPFDPADTSFDGAARFYLTPYCRGCVDACHDNEIADH